MKTVLYRVEFKGIKEGRGYFRTGDIMIITFENYGCMN